MRIKSIDMLRGIAVISMLFFQILDFVSNWFNLYNRHYIGTYFNWFSIFMVVSGFSLALMFRKYDSYTFLKRLVGRCLLLIGLGYFLISLVVHVQPFDEVLIGIGVSWFILGLLKIATDYLFTDKKNRLIVYLAVMVLCLMLSMIMPFSFNPFWVLPFMLFGLIMFELGRNMKFPLFLGVVSFSVLGVFHNSIDYYSRTLPFFVLNVGVTSILFVLMVLLERNFIEFGDFLAYFGRNSLLFYFLHFGLIYSLFGEKVFPIGFDIAFTILSIFWLILIEKLLNQLRGLAKGRKFLKKLFIPR